MEYDAAMSNIFQLLMNIAQDFLVRSKMQPNVIDDNEYEFAMCICETMVALGSSNMQCILADVARTLHFLQQVRSSKYTSPYISYTRLMLNAAVQHLLL